MGGRLRVKVVGWFFFVWPGLVLCRDDGASSGGSRFMLQM